MPVYWIWVMAAVALCSLYAIIRTKQSKLPTFFVWLFPPSALVLGYVCSKLLYCILQASSIFSPQDFSLLFFSTHLTEFSFFGAGLGVLLALAVTALISNVPFFNAVDAVLPPCLLLVALARFGEFSTSLGYGAYMENVHFFPISIQNEYGEWFGAVFMLEGLFALAIYLWILAKPGQFPGDSFMTALFYLCLSQIFCESLRAVSIRWGFIRCEQVLCALAVLAILGLEHRRLVHKRGWMGRINPLMFCALLCLGLLILVEFALDRSSLPTALCYSFMVFVLAVLAYLRILYRKKIENAIL